MVWSIDVRSLAPALLCLIILWRWVVVGCWSAVAVCRDSHNMRVLALSSIGSLGKRNTLGLV